jgi:Ca-activated chloride channel family protein
MTFANPVLLAAGLIVAAALALAALDAARRRAAALTAAGLTVGRPAGAATRAARRGRLSGLWLTIAGIAVLAVAVAGPAVTVPVSHASGTVILAMDVSGSMAATDVPPDRLDAAKEAAQAFVNAQPPSVDIGVVAFEQSGLEAAVPTADHSATLAAITRLSPGGGTSLGSAILAALSAITHKAVEIGPNGSAPSIGFWPSATIVLFSDGGDSSGGSSGSGSDVGSGGADTATAAEVAQKAGVHVDTVGVGTAAGTTVDVDGYHLFTGLDAANLQAISQVTGGAYHPASTASELDGLARSINLRLTVTNQPLPLAGAFIAFALVLLAAGAVLTVTRTGRVI